MKSAERLMYIQFTSCVQGLFSCYSKNISFCELETSNNIVVRWKQIIWDTIIYFYSTIDLFIIGLQASAKESRMSPPSVLGAVYWLLWCPVHVIARWKSECEFKNIFFSSQIRKVTGDVNTKSLWKRSVLHVVLQQLLNKGKSHHRRQNRLITQTTFSASTAIVALMKLLPRGI